MMQRSKLIILGAVIATASFSLNAQSANSQGNSRSSLPPGLQKREQLPPGLQNRDELPPGLQKRQGRDTDDINVPSGSNTGTSNDVSSSTGIQGTNQSGATSNSASGQLGLNSSNNVSGQFGSISNQSSGMTPTSNRGTTNRVYGTNRTSTSGQTSATRQDRAYTRADQRLLVQIRQTVLPILGASSGAATTTSETTTTTGQAWAPVHFIVQQNVVTLVGYVPTVQEKQHIITTVQRVPGVVRVVDELTVSSENSVETGAVGGTTGSSLGSAVAGGATSQYGASSSTNNQFGLNTSNQVGVTSSNQIGGTMGQFGTTTNQTTSGEIGLSTSNSTSGSLSAETGSTNSTGSNVTPTGGDTNRIYQNLPPGLQKRGGNLPPGLEKREQLPPGLQRGTNSDSQ